MLMGVFDWLKRQFQGSDHDADADDDNWQKNWDSRLAALEIEFGKSGEDIFTSLIPIYLGGGSDVLSFKHHIDGVVYVTAGLIGDGGQKKTALGEYELMMCVREENDWTPSLLSRLASYTFEAALESGQTMDIGPAMPDGSSIAGLLFESYRQFEVNEAAAGLLLCIGLTESELLSCRNGERSKVVSQLKSNNVYPFTDSERQSVV